MTAGVILTDSQNYAAKSSEVLILQWWEVWYTMKWSDLMNTAKTIMWRWSSPDIALNKWSQEVIKQIADVIVCYWALRGILETEDCQISIFQFTFKKFFAFSCSWRWWGFFCCMVSFLQTVTDAAFSAINYWAGKHCWILWFLMAVFTFFTPD